MKKPTCLRLSMLMLLVLAAPALSAKNVYQEPDAFIAEVFAGTEVQKKRLWLDRDLLLKIGRILDHKPRRLRIRYWQSGLRTAWILEEIGKTEPITMGFVVNAGRLELARVLIFRESRGWEIRYPFFTDQYKDLSLAGDMQLSSKIDGISGATMSVAAVNKMAKLALLLHEHSDAVVKH